MKWGIALCGALGLAAVHAAAQAPAPAGGQRPAALERVVEEQLAADEAARATQERINALDDETQAMLSEYRRALADAESYATYARQLEAQVAAQNEEMNAMNGQLVEVETTSREIAPLLERMLETLDRFVELDAPFLLDERRERVAKLEQTMTRADVAISEKYRRIVEAYQVELDYGRTIEAYEAKLGDAADARTVQMLRVGRVALLYQTLDGEETGYWDARARAWVVDDAYAHGFAEGVAVARKTRAPELLIVPVPAPAEAPS